MANAEFDKAALVRMIKALKARMGTYKTLAHQLGVAVQTLYAWADVNQESKRPNRANAAKLAQTDVNLGMSKGSVEEVFRLWLEVAGYDTSGLTPSMMRALLPVRHPVRDELEHAVQLLRSTMLSEDDPRFRSALACFTSQQAFLHELHSSLRPETRPIVLFVWRWSRGTTIPRLQEEQMAMFLRDLLEQHRVHRVLGFLRIDSDLHPKDWEDIRREVGRLQGRLLRDSEEEVSRLQFFSRRFDTASHHQDAWCVLGENDFRPAWFASGQDPRLQAWVARQGSNEIRQRPFTWSATVYRPPMHTFRDYMWSYDLGDGSWGSLGYTPGHSWKQLVVGA